MKGRGKGGETMPENKCADSCPDLTRLEQQVKDLQKQNGEDHKEIRDRLSKAEMTNAIQNERYDAILKELGTLTDSVKELNAKLSALEAKPGKRWEGIVEKSVWAVAAAVIAFLLGRIGL